MLAHFDTVADILRLTSPVDPVYILRHDEVAAAARQHLEAFPGPVLYAVKCNDHPAVIAALSGAGIRHFDTASLAEIRLVRQVAPGAHCSFMHPIKPSEHIGEAYAVHGVRDFALDHPYELEKIVAETGGAGDCLLFVRIAVPKLSTDQVAYDLSGKFGANADQAVHLLRAIRDTGAAAGITFHVGSQCGTPGTFERAVSLSAAIAEEAGISLQALDVGGGFPARYLGQEPQFSVFGRAIRGAVARHGLDHVELRCEPGRSLAIDAMSALVRVEMRRDDRARPSLYLTDGFYGGLSELKIMGPRFPIRIFRNGAPVTGDRHDYDLFGPTCDSADAMPGPFAIEGDVQPGDYLEIGMCGAYSQVLSGDFNGCHNAAYVSVGEGAWWHADARQALAA